jgi:hypothetical protein
MVRMQGRVHDGTNRLLLYSIKKQKFRNGSIIHCRVQNAVTG